MLSRDDRLKRLRLVEGMATRLWSRVYLEATVQGYIQLTRGRKKRNMKKKMTREEFERLDAAREPFEYGGVTFIPMHVCKARFRWSHDEVMVSQDPNDGTWTARLWIGSHAIEAGPTGRRDEAIDALMLAIREAAPIIAKFASVQTKP